MKILFLSLVPFCTFADFYDAQFFAKVMIDDYEQMILSYKENYPEIASEEIDKQESAYHYGYINGACDAYKQISKALDH